MGLTNILTLICLLSFHSLANSANLETYIVHVEFPESDHNPLSTASSSSSNEDLDRWYNSFLPTTTVSSSNNEAPQMVYCYHNVFKGFAAQLSAEDVTAMKSKPGFVSAQPQQVFYPDTTHSPSFLGLHQNTGVWSDTNYGKGVIIGVVDSGITPNHPSFGDKGMPPPPAKWKGKCDFNASICNNKVIGVRYFNGGIASPIDDDGHGSHTAGTAAGNFVKGANVFGNARGTAAGVAPLAHLAIYKVCLSSCTESDLLAGIDAAIGDGVDILSISISGPAFEQFYESNIALGAYSAVKKGIFVSCSAGNRGPLSSTVRNQAPWILTVGASTTDRKIRATAVLGNKEELDGESLFQPKNFPSKLYPLYYPGANESDPNASNRDCSFEFTNIAEVKGKIVVCDGDFFSQIDKGKTVKATGGAGMIIINSGDSGYSIPSEAHVLPATHLSYADGLKLIAYINSTSSPVAAISFKGTIIGDSHAPAVASFSGRGLNRVSRGILKPDILGPGVNILAAWFQSVENRTNTKSNFNIISGTSMSCPHLSGVATLLKSAHPDWSPAAIKSAIMTTADLVNLAKNPIETEDHIPASVLDTGSGHVNPTRANNPGLIYDIEPKDYISYLCGLNYTDRQVGRFVQGKIRCTTATSIPESQLNYPSIAVVFGPTVQSYTRTVTNVGEAKSVYTVKVVPPPNINVTVKPQKLSFSKVNQKLTYEVTFGLSSTPDDVFVGEGSITWTSSKHSVRIPIAGFLGVTLD